VKVTIQPSTIKGDIQAPASKSSMQRACALALLAKGTTIIHNPGHSNDDRAALDIIRRLGADLKEVNGEWAVASEGFPISALRSPVSIDCGESGLSIRMFTPIAALSDKEITIDGSGSLLTRPMDFFDEILPKLGVKVKSNNGKLPLTIQGPLRPANIEVDGSLSSQFLTGLLLAYAASPGTSKAGVHDSDSPGISIKVRDLKSKPYIDLTLDVMSKFGMRMPENRNYEEFIFHFGSGLTTHDLPAEHAGSRVTTRLPDRQDHEYTVEGDWSGGAFLLVAGAIAGSINVNGLDLTSAQADKAIVDALMSANAGIAMEAKGIKMHPAEMNAFTFDATDCPDLFPPLVALASYCKGETKIKGVNRLTHKESNRALTLQEEFGKMGVKIELGDDFMVIHGGNGIRGALVHSRHDHRIAMALATAALKASSETVIEEAEAIEKSYPDFYNDLGKLRANVSLNNKYKFHE
jgi:3-phosphoshikimate 1-carboxyvinyltransferase